MEKKVAWKAKEVGCREPKGMNVGHCECQKLPESSDISTAARQVDGEAPTPKLSPHPLVQDSPLGRATPPPHLCMCPSGQPSLWWSGDPGRALFAASCRNAHSGTPAREKEEKGEKMTGGKSKLLQ